MTTQTKLTKYFSMTSTNNTNPMLKRKCSSTETKSFDKNKCQKLLTPESSKFSDENLTKASAFYKGILTEEQKHIVDQVIQKKNTLINAKAGTGKTTTSIAAAVEYLKLNPGEKVLLLCYNAELKSDTRKTLKKHHLSKMIIAESFHSCALNMFVHENKASLKGVFDNRIIFSAIRSRILIKSFNLIIIDEIQDMTECFCEFVQHLLSLNFAKRNQVPATIVTCGDPFQQIYRFMQADLKYFTSPQEFFFQGDQHELYNQFFILTLSYNFRCPRQVIEYIQKHLNPMNLKYAATKTEWEKYGSMIEQFWGKGILSHESVKDDSDSFIELNWKGEANQRRGCEIILERLVNVPDKSTITFLSTTNRNPATEVIFKFLKNKDKTINTEIVGEKTVTKKPGKIYSLSVHKFKGCENEITVYTSWDTFYENKCKTFEDILDEFNKQYVGFTRGKKLTIVLGVSGESFVTKRLTPSIRLEPNRSTKNDEELPTCQVKKHLIAHNSENKYLDDCFRHEEIFVSDAKHIEIDPTIQGYFNKQAEEDLSIAIGVAIECRIFQLFHTYKTIHTGILITTSFLGNCFYVNQMQLAKNRIADASMRVNGYPNPIQEWKHHLIRGIIDKTTELGNWNTYEQIVGPEQADILITNPALSKWITDNTQNLDTIIENVRLCFATLSNLPPNATWNDLLPHVEHKNTELCYVPSGNEYASFLKMYSGVSGKMDFLIDKHKIVELKFTKFGLLYEFMSQVKVYETLATKNLLPGKTTPPYESYVFICNTGQLYRIHWKTPESLNDYLDRMILRKGAEKPMIPDATKFNLFF